MKRVELNRGGRQFRPQIRQQCFQLRALEHRGLDQQGTCPLGDERGVGLDLPLDLGGIKNRVDGFGRRIHRR